MFPFEVVRQNCDNPHDAAAEDHSPRVHHSHPKGDDPNEDKGPKTDDKTDQSHLEITDGQFEQSQEKKDGGIEEAKNERKKDISANIRNLLIARDLYARTDSIDKKYDQKIQKKASQIIHCESIPVACDACRFISKKLVKKLDFATF